MHWCDDVERGKCIIDADARERTGIERCIKWELWELCDLCQALTHPEGASAVCGMRTTANSVYLRTLGGGSFPHLQFSTDADDCRGQLGYVAMQERAARAVGDGTS